MRNQAMSVFAYGKSVYIGGNGEGNLWSVWKYDGKMGVNEELFSRIHQLTNEQQQYKKCPNGHYYRGNGHCPYCPSSEDGEKGTN